jgi:release factor glutamine methyltransferase
VSTTISSVWPTPSAIGLVPTTQQTNVNCKAVNYLTFDILNNHLLIKTSPRVFSPSPHGSKALGSSIIIHPGERVLDIGTGTGLLAILAAKMGGVVSATDILPEAVSLSQDNALLNDVRIDARVGDLFSPFSKSKFDVIIANVPQEVVSPYLKAKWDQNEIIAVSGGPSGTEVLAEVLSLAPQYMHEGSRLYCVVYTMTNYRHTLQAIASNYTAHLMNFYSGPVKKFVYEDLNWYLTQPQLQLYKNGNEYFADLFAFELRLPRIGEVHSGMNSPHFHSGLGEDSTGISTIRIRP